MDGCIVGAPSTYDFSDLFLGKGSAHTEECLARTFSPVKKDWSEDWSKDLAPGQSKEKRAARLVKEWSKEWSKDFTPGQSERARATGVVRVCICESLECPPLTRSHR
jgi:hypothetical protein